MKLKKTTIPLGSMLSKYLPVNYSDAYECEFVSDKAITPDDLVIDFWTYQPKWMEILFRLRNALVKPFGLESDNSNDTTQLAEAVRSGGKYKLMSVADKSDNETIVLLSDKHLDAYISAYIEYPEGNRKKITVTTLVRFHYWLGYVYFYAIYPFHHMVVKGMMKAIVKRLM